MIGKVMSARRGLVLRLDLAHESWWSLVTLGWRI